MKHFLHSGFGIRQVCDIFMLSCANAGTIDWEILRKRCGKVHAIPFVTAIYQIGCRYLLSETQADILRSSEKGAVNASKTIRIAEERIRLLSQYGLLPEER